MMGPGVMRVTVTVLRGRQVESGVWCDVDALPSAVLIEYLVAFGGRPAAYLMYRWCPTCCTAELGRPVE